MENLFSMRTNIKFLFHFRNNLVIPLFIAKLVLPVMAQNKVWGGMKNYCICIGTPVAPFVSGDDLDNSWRGVDLNRWFGIQFEVCKLRPGRQ